MFYAMNDYFLKAVEQVGWRDMLLPPKSPLAEAWFIMLCDGPPT